MERRNSRRDYSYDRSTITVGQSSIGYVGGDIEEEAASGGRGRHRRISVAARIAVSALIAQAPVRRSRSQPAAAPVGQPVVGRSRPLPAAAPPGPPQVGRSLPIAAAAAIAQPVVGRSQPLPAAAPPGPPQVGTTFLNGKSHFTSINLEDLLKTYDFSSEIVSDDTLIYLKEKFNKLSAEFEYIDFENHCLLRNQRSLNGITVVEDAIFGKIIIPLHDISTLYLQPDNLKRINNQQLADFELNFKRMMCTWKTDDLGLYATYAMSCITYDKHIYEARHLIRSRHESNSFVLSMALSLEERINLHQFKSAKPIIPKMRDHFGYNEYDYAVGMVVLLEESVIVLTDDSTSPESPIQCTRQQLIKKMAALEKELEELREQLTSKEELIDILIKEKDALKMRLEYEQKEAAKA
ncbi:hypothetical protein DAPPUDRAFT_323233 [Daphnia pulex]|uniref:Uncharacterized protein n=1 Tax=Daphnia pulex TaxID=6669 RepID=E9GY99_DAPPU|nr:hypothetical protein DAPPUDRAFT_323233 [Daphnia pulex]|eukprot:EFX75597.1 hypothetical protein DAPPUDRAFT_323233 [Daphnia pulex]